MPDDAIHECDGGGCPLDFCHCEVGDAVELHSDNIKELILAAIEDGVDRDADELAAVFKAAVASYLGGVDSAYEIVAGWAHDACSHEAEDEAEDEAPEVEPADPIED